MERQPDGASLREHLESAWRQKNFAPEAMPQKLRLPDIPAAVAHLWDWFCELSGARTGSSGGPNPIQFSEIEAWARLTGRALAPRDVQAIALLDQAFFAELAEQDRRRDAARRQQAARKR
jgi:hypothetical protein